MKENIFGKTKNELANLVSEIKLPEYTCNQIASWIYQKHIISFNEMTNLSIKARKTLSDIYTIEKNSPENIQESTDGTKKYLYKTFSGKYIEAAYIPEKERNTLCLSTQSGCLRACRFCMTGKQGFQGNLTAADIINQFECLPERDKVTNIVYMGMGEPLDNLEEVLKSLEIFSSDYGYGISPRKITVSTVGILPALKILIEKTKCHIAISLHNPFADERKLMMPVEETFSVKDIISELKKYKIWKYRRISFEYIMFKNINDTKHHVYELIRLLNGLNCRMNLIRFHEIEGISYKSSDDNTINIFKEELTKKGLTTTIRTSRGQDIKAACGLLSTLK